MGGIVGFFQAKQRRAPGGSTQSIATADGDETTSRLARAVFGLAEQQPQFSARIVATRAQISLLLALALALLVFAAQWPRQTANAAVWIMSLGFLVSVVTRCALVFLGRARQPATPIANDTDWPTYSILVPLYHEATILPQLAAALNALDYPPEKLDIRLVLEEDDHETRAAAERLSYLHVLVPAAAPRTKPKACTYAASECQGEFVVVYDAEDRPEPDQLKKAVGAFRTHPAISCFQARLVIDRSRCWLQHMFSLDYGIWFGALLPGLERLRAPIPLGGTSNHFRRAALVDAGLWDPFNVTEDADLGMRMARLGYQVGVLDSMTLEEAPAALSVWLPQRTRWLKGYMQTLLVHSRNPGTLRREIGIIGLAAMQAFLGGAIWSALVNPLLWLCFIAATLAPSPSANALTDFAQASGISLLLMNALLAALSATRWRGDNKRPSMIAIVSYPVYWLLISVAAYRGLWQLVCNPFAWEKTPHGTSAVTGCAGS
jgi:cellulose synthase/poly-beta-1,6-N-acetylglucosamine synthase-like glycosyltransferase